jgi:predicted nucleic acid-binding protein
LTKAVLNSSALIALSATGHINKLQSIFDELIVARAVYEEICVKGRGLLGEAELTLATENGTVKIKRVTNCVTVNALLDPLGQGEAETITLAIEEEADYVVLDDRLARRKARTLGLNVIGTLRVLRMMLDSGLVSKEELAASLETLVQIGFRISTDIIEKVFKL